MVNILDTLSNETRDKYITKFRKWQYLYSMAVYYDKLSNGYLKSCVVVEADFERAFGSMDKVLEFMIKADICTKEEFEDE